MKRTKVGLTLEAETVAKLHALAYALGLEQGRLVDEAVRCHVAALPPADRERYDAARSARA